MKKQGTKEVQVYKTFKGQNNQYTQNIYDIIEKDSFAYIIAEWFPVGSLKVYLEKAEFLEEQDALFIFKQVLLGL